MTPTIEQQPSLQEQRKSAETALADAQSETQAARVAAEELESKLTAEQNFRARLEEKYDQAAVDEREQDALELKAQLAASEVKRRGLELRLESAHEDVSACQEAEKPLAEALSQAMHAEALEAEERELLNMIEAAENAYTALVKAAERLEESLAGLKTKAWIEPAHAGAANDCWFRVTSHVRGFNC